MQIQLTTVYSNISTSFRGNFFSANVFSFLTKTSENFVFSFFEKHDLFFSPPPPFSCFGLIRNEKGGKVKVVKGVDVAEFLELKNFSTGRFEI